MLMVAALPSSAAAAPPAVIDGALDLTGTKLADGGSVDLTGSWLFQWGNLAAPAPWATLDVLDRKFSFYCALSNHAAIPVCVDFLRIEQVLTNLVDNAIAHTRPGGQIGISCRHFPHFADGKGDWCQ
jgi:signal transduction histidine kinase